MNDHAIVYYWWNNDKDKAYEDITNPVVPSIAVLRALNSEVSVYVLDVSDVPSDWGDFPEKLDFKVIPWHSRMDIDSVRLRGRYKQFCARMWDIWQFSQEIDENIVIYTDSDIFWLKDPIPLRKEHDGRLDYFHGGPNAGVWYFDRRSDQAKTLFNTWKSMVLLSVIDDNFYEDIKADLEIARQYPLHDEIVLNYIGMKMPGLFRHVDKEENFLIDNLRHHRKIVQEAKCIHVLSGTTGIHRGRICLCLKELRDSMLSTLSTEDVELIFGNIEPESVCSIFDIREMDREEVMKILSFTGNPKAWIPEDENVEQFPTSTALAGETFLW